MRDYRTVETTAEVWVAIRKAHPELTVFGSYSAPGGDFYGNPAVGKMFTSYGFKQGEFPVIEAETTWDIDPREPYTRKNEGHKYWLCLPDKTED